MEKHILIVDDEPMIVKMVSSRLRANDYEVKSAIDGEDALKKVKEEKPALIILDLMLPKMNGYEVCRRLKADPEYRSIPIILFTARAQDRDEKMGYEAGADAYIAKPFSANNLLAKMEKLLQRNLST